MPNEVQLYTQFERLHHWLLCWSKMDMNVGYCVSRVLNHCTNGKIKLLRFFFSFSHLFVGSLKKVFGICEGKNTKMWLNALPLVVHLYSTRKKFNDLSKLHKINLKLIGTTSPLLSLILVFMIDFHLKKS